MACKLGRGEEEFDWLAWWGMVHSNVVSSLQPMVAFVLPGTEAAFALFHWSGMLGTSEAHAESIGNLLKSYPASWKTQRVVDATLLKSCGYHEIGADDGFIQLVWARFFASASCSKFSFRFRSNKGKRAGKQRKLGHGSRTVERILRKSCVRRCTPGELRQVARMPVLGELGVKTNFAKRLRSMRALLYE